MNKEEEHLFYNKRLKIWDTIEELEKGAQASP
jgi:hypothetical protein